MLVFYRNGLRESTALSKLGGRRGLDYGTINCHAVCHHSSFANSVSV